jgi:hypothetical protein
MTTLFSVNTDKAVGAPERVAAAVHALELHRWASRLPQKAQTDALLSSPVVDAFAAERAAYARGAPVAYKTTEEHAALFAPHTVVYAACPVCDAFMVPLRRRPRHRVAHDGRTDEHMIGLRSEDGEDWEFLIRQHGGKLTCGNESCGADMFHRPPGCKHQRPIRRFWSVSLCAQLQTLMFSDELLLHLSCKMAEVLAAVAAEHADDADEEAAGVRAVLADWYDGNNARRMYDDGGDDGPFHRERDLPVIVHTDGISPFLCHPDSETHSCWPVVVVLPNLPPRLRGTLGRLMVGLVEGETSFAYRCVRV